MRKQKEELVNFINFLNKQLGFEMEHENKYLYTANGGLHNTQP